MNDNKDNSLFTEMFGLPSEQPTEPQKMESQTEPVINSSQTIIKENKAEEVEVKIDENPSVVDEPISLNSESDISTLNYQDTEKNISNTESIIEMTPTKQEVEEIITLTPGIVEEPKNEEEQPIVENNILYSPEYIQPQVTEAPIVKKNKIVFNIIISILTGLSLCLGWYFVYTEFLSSDIDETKVEEIEEEKEEEPEEPIIEEPKLNFDENLSFYKGLTSNEVELYQERPYTPQEKTGVVKCENITPINQDNLLQVQNVYYIYYENYLTKKVLFVQTSTFQYQNLYNASLNSFDELEKAWEGKKGFKYIVKKYPDKNQIENTILINLAYGSYFVTDRDSKIYYRLSFKYNDKIAEVQKSIMNIEMNQGNLYCSTVLTK